MLYIANIQKNKITTVGEMKRTSSSTDTHIVEAIDISEVQSKIQAYHDSQIVDSSVSYDISYISIHPLL